MSHISDSTVRRLSHYYRVLQEVEAEGKRLISSNRLAEREGIKPEDVFSVSVMPCTAKKFEARRKELFMPDGSPSTDAVLTTRELIWMMKTFGIEFRYDFSL
jgi:iron only hydrogenase large subunit-like protein